MHLQLRAELNIRKKSSSNCIYTENKQLVREWGQAVKS